MGLTDLRHANTPPSEKHFPFLKLPAELRLRVYSYIVPGDQRIFLDPDNIHRPLPYTWTSHGSTKDLLLANKQIHTEAINFIFNRNIANLIHPEDPRKDRFFNLGTSNHNCIRVLELHVPRTHLRGLEKQCAVMEKCPNLTDLRLVMYHDLSWQTMFAELAYYVTTHEKDMCLDLEAYTSVVVLPVHMQQLEKSFRESLQHIATGSAVYDLKIPRHVRHIIVTVSTTNDTAERLHRLTDVYNQWAFKHVSYQKGPPEMTCIRWFKKDVLSDELLQPRETVTHQTDDNRVDDIGGNDVA
ncbi:hypothetical protein SCAR479_06994 [Seiridium cardinale]|uniref:Uncharacterized protein n=1 Tax=Seiridium cardinale TaxID=138064 RepID=A0ABR2XRG3_9PEZI